MASMCKIKLEDPGPKAAKVLLGRGYHTDLGLVKPLYLLV
jgi:hypothetical protein